MDKKCTVNEVLSWNPSEPGVVLRKERLPTLLLHKFTCWVTASCLHAERERGREPDPQSWDAVTTKWKWIHGESTDDELAAARAAAWEAWKAAGVTAWEAAWAAAWAATWEAAGAARVTTVAAREAARWEAGKAAAEAAPVLQISILKNLIEEERCE